MTWKIEGFLESRDGRLHIDGVDAVELAREYGTPLFVYSEPRIRHNIGRLKKIGEVIGCAFKLCYAAKAMSTLGVLRAVREAGCDLEVNSGGELLKALKAGFNGDQLNFNGLSKEVWELELAVENGVYAIQVDSLYELSLIEETAKRLNKSANVSLRLVPEIESATHSGLQTALLTSKFGMMPEEAFGAFVKYKNSEHLNLNGLHLHVGSQNPSPDVYTQAFEEMFNALLRIYRESGVRLKHINLGGGFPVNYSRGMQSPPEHIQKKIEEMISKGYVESSRHGVITRHPIPRNVVEKYERQQMFAADFDPSDALAVAWAKVKEKAQAEGISDLLNEITLLVEPGRSIIADTGICLTTVRNIKKRPLSNINESTNKMVQERLKEEKDKLESGEQSISFGVYDVERSFSDPNIKADHWLLTDAGFNILLSMETYKWYYHLISAERADEEHSFPYKVAGPLCDGGDVYFDVEGHGRLPDHRLLPENIQPGEVLALLNCGAYSLAQASQYNARYLPAVILTKGNGKTELIRKRDTFEDLIANDIY